MANHKSAIKRAKQNEIKRIRNKSVKTMVKNSKKKVISAVANNSKEEAVTNLNLAKSLIAKAAKKGTIHKNNASRNISRLTNLVNSISA